MPLKRRKPSDPPDEIIKKEKVLREGDWMIKWTPDAPEGDTGFVFYTPMSFDPNKGGGPLGGMILAAVYYLLENGTREFPKELVDRANQLAREIGGRDSGSMSSSGKTLN
jgi:hypothetical protein